MDQGSDRELLRAFRRAVRSKIERDLEKERDAAAARRQRALPLVARALSEARASGRCAEAWLFGSYAWGQPGEHSDIDVLAAGCPDPDGLAGSIGTLTGTEVHVIRLESAPPDLRDRVLSEGTKL